MPCDVVYQDDAVTVKVDNYFDGCGSARK